MNAEPLCPGCGRPLPANAPRGMCPECLMQGAFPTGTDTGGSARFVAPTVEELAPRFPQFEVLAFIGQGGMGAVYQARQKQLDRIVALKILPPGIGPDAAFAERFGREARALARLNHPGIVTIHDFGQADGLYYLVMEYVDGVTLRQLLHGGRISAREALAIVPQICDALQFAHDQGIVHRDIKPENILLDRRGRVKVADFGLAKIMEPNSGRADLPVSPDLGSATSEAPSGVMGTPNYMAPEQMDHPGEVDHRADIYALGVVFYQMLTGELPTGKFEPPSKKVHIDVRLDEIVLRALEKKPELRYQQAGDVKTCVETIVATPQKTSPPNPIAKLMKSKNSVLIMIVLLLIAAGAVFTFLQFWKTHPAKPAGLVASWSGGGKGKNAADGRESTLTDISFVSGKNGPAFSFNGASSTVTIPASPALNVGAYDLGFTITAWIKPSDVNGLHPLIEWLDNNGVNLWIGIRPSENGVLRADINPPDGNHFLCSHPDVLVKDSFQQIAFTYDKNSGEGRLYVNGVIVARRQLGAQLAVNLQSDLYFSHIFYQNLGWSYRRAFAGLMDDIAIYKRPLTAAEIQKLCAQEDHGEPLVLPAPSDGWFEPWMR